jgi:hypothetical protein
MYFIALHGMSHEFFLPTQEMLLKSSPMAAKFTEIVAISYR